MAHTLQAFTINFGTGLCGLEILFDEQRREFTVGNVFKDSSQVAAKYADVLPGAVITSLNKKPTTGLGSMPEIQAMFKAAAKTNKFVSFKSLMPADKVAKLATFYSEADAAITKFNPMHYYASLPRRPLGFTVAATPGQGLVEVCQVDSVHEEDILLGSQLLAVNDVPVEDLDHGIKLLLECKMPVSLLFEQRAEIFENDEKEEEGLNDDWYLQQSYDKDEEIFLDVDWLTVSDYGKEMKAAHGVFQTNCGKSSPVALIRAKIAAVSGLKYEALKLIANGKQLKDDQQKIWDAIYDDNKKTRKQKVIVVVSQKEQAKKEVISGVDYRTRMRLRGAYFKTVDSKVLNYLWDDIDHEKKELLHITELDRLLARLTGLYERAMSIKPQMQYEFTSVQFATNRNLGLVIEGNEVIMCHANSQAAEQGIMPAWKVVGAEYTSSKTKKKIKLSVDHKSCLQSLKRAKTECTDNGFKVLCQQPVGPRHELQIVMKKQAIADLNLNDGTQTLTKVNYAKLAGVFAPKAYRVTIPTKPQGDDPGVSIVAPKDTSQKGAFVHEVSNNNLTVNKGDRVIGVNRDDVATKKFTEINKVFAAKFPMVWTFDAATDYDDAWEKAVAK